jgi:F-type H+-transporting ATPase subunit b
MISRILTAATEGGTAPNPLLPADYDILWSSVVFAVLLLFFWFRVLPNFKKTLDARTEAIEGRLEAAEIAQAEAKAQTEQMAKAQETVRAEASAIREEARAEGAAILAELKEQAQLEAQRMTQNAKVQIEAERQAAVISLRSEVGSMAIDLASKVVAASLKDGQLASNVVDDFLKELEASEKTGKNK